MTPEELIKILKQYRRESNQSERLLDPDWRKSSHIESLALDQPEPNERQVGVNCMLPHARRIPVGFGLSR